MNEGTKQEKLTEESLPLRRDAINIFLVPGGGITTARKWIRRSRDAFSVLEREGVPESKQDLYKRLREEQSPYFRMYGYTILGIFDLIKLGGLAYIAYNVAKPLLE